MTDTARPPFSGRFVFTVDGVEIGAFTEVSGLSAELEVEEVVEGGQNQFVHKLPGRMTWPSIVLKCGVTSSERLFEWFARSSGEGFAAQGDKLERSDGAVVLVDAAGEPVRTWTFADAFPVKWTGPTLAASASDVAVEELEIAHHGFR
jgi:phage tail-like protein